MPVIPRLKSGGQLASAINAIIDYLPRLAIQSTPDITATVTPRGQLVSLKNRRTTQTGAPSATTNFPFKATIRADNPGSPSPTYKVFVRWGTVNGQSVMTYPEEEVGTAADGKRVVLNVVGNFSSTTSTGISNPSLAIEDTSALLVAGEVGGAINYKIVLAYIMEEEDGTFTVSQQTGGHQIIGLYGA
jgi:hypothetical protein